MLLTNYWSCPWVPVCMRFLCAPLEWALVFLSPVKWSEVKSLSRVRLFETPWTVAYQAPQSMEFSRQESWNGLPVPSPGALPDPGIKPWCRQTLYHLSHQGSPVRLLQLSPAGLQSHTLCWACLSSTRTLACGTWLGVHNSHSYRRISPIQLFSTLWIWLYCESTPPAHLTVVLSFYLYLEKIFSGRI